MLHTVVLIPLINELYIYIVDDLMVFPKGDVPYSEGVCVCVFCFLELVYSPTRNR